MWAWGLARRFPLNPIHHTLLRNPAWIHYIHRRTPSYSNASRPLLYHLVLVAINAHFTVSDNKGVDLCDVAHRTRSQYAVQPSCECVRILLEHLQP